MSLNGNQERTDIKPCAGSCPDDIKLTFPKAAAIDLRRVWL
jgi:hypothetical protein